MDAYVTSQATDLLSAPDLKARVLATLPADTAFNGTAHAGFIATTIPAAAPQPGFVFGLDAHKVPTAVRAIAPEEFILFCALVTTVARNEGANRDYLMALAYAGTANLSDLGAPGAERVGPFQFTEADWSAAIGAGPAKGRNLLPEDRLEWTVQPLVAALLAVADTARLAAGLGRSPGFAELCFAQRSGPAAEAKLFAVPRPAELTQALAAVQQELVLAYAEALKTIDQLPPQDRLVEAQGGDPPWLVVAREEQRRGVAEIPGAADNERIVRYHRSAGVQGGDGTAWCGSFATFCMKTSGVPAVEASVAGLQTASAANWRAWGAPAQDPSRIGTVVVMRPQGAASGHVGFLVEGSDERHVMLLAGNQGGIGGKPDHVGVVSWPVAEVVAWRWLDAPAAADQVADLAAAGRRDALFVGKAPAIMHRLMRDFPGMARHQAAAVLGNIGHECRGFLSLHQDGMAPGQGGHGWCQWDGVRRDAFLLFAAGLHADWHDDESNYAFLQHELQTSEAAALSSLLRQGSRLEAVADFDRKFERSGKPNLSSRDRYAALAAVAFDRQQ